MANSNVITLDFRNVSPAGRSSTVDYIDPGRYQFVVTSIETKKTAAGDKDMVVAEFKVSNGPMRNRRLIDRFTIPTGPNDSIYGMQRLRSFLTACGADIQSKQLKVDLSQFVKGTFEANIVDENVPEKTVGAKTYQARVISRVDEYIIEEPKAKALKAKAADDDEEDDDEEEEAPKVTKKKAKPPVDEDEEGDEPAPPPLLKKAKPPVDDDDDDDEDTESLFS